MQSSRFTAALSITLILVLTEKATAQTPIVPVTSQTPPEANVALCYLRTSNGSVRDLTKLCGDPGEASVPDRTRRSANESAIASVEPATPPSQNRCFILDATGNPCPAAQ